MVNVILTSITKDFAELDINNAVTRAINLLDYRFSDNMDTIVIKPNLCYYWDHSTGETTDPRVVSAIIDFIRDEIGTDAHICVAEADASAMKTRYAFKMLGYEELSRRKKVELVNLSKGDIVEREVSIGDNKLTLQLNKLLLESDLIINVPKLKTHRIAGVTCSLKNMFGAIAKPKKYVYHKCLSEVIVGINKLVKSNIVIVDGIIARGRYPKKMGILMASDDALAADFIAAKIMGLNPCRIKHLSLAKDEKIGNVNRIDLVEDKTSLRRIKTSFPKQNYSLKKLSWRVQLKLLRFYSKVLGDVIPPILNDTLS
jgi:uncharacterized protein (DUF362 family)